jgi:hypothetical protein
MARGVITHGCDLHEQHPQVLRVVRVAQVHNVVGLQTRNMHRQGWLKAAGCRVGVCGGGGEVPEDGAITTRHYTTQRTQPHTPSTTADAPPTFHQ